MINFEIENNKGYRVGVPVCDDNTGGGGIDEVQFNQKIDNKVTDGTLASGQAVDNLTSQLENIVTDTNTKFSGVENKKLDKNGIVTMANMGQDVKQAMTGGSVAVVGKGAVLTENIIANQITPITTTFFDVVNQMDTSTMTFYSSYCDTSGVIKASADSKSVVFRVQPNTTYKLKFDGIANNRAIVVGNSDKSFNVGSTYSVLQTIGTTNIIPFTTQATTQWVFVYFISTGDTLTYYESVKNKFMLYKNDVPQGAIYDTINKNYLPKDILFKGGVLEDDTNFFDIYNVLISGTGKILMANCTTDGLVTINSDGTSIIVNASPNTEYYFKLANTTNRSYVLSSSSDFVSGNRYDVVNFTKLSDKIIKFITPSNTSKLFLYVQNTYQNYDIRSDFSLTTSFGYLGSNFKIKKDYLPPINDSYTNKRILTMGDSITAINEVEVNDWARSWRKYFKEIFNPRLFINTAVPGATWRDKVGTIYDGNPVVNGIDNNINNVMGNQMEKILRGKDPTYPNYSKVADYDDFDIIIIACGTNDTEWVIPTQSEIETQFFNGNTPITDLKTLDRKSWTGSLRYAIDNLRKLYPSAKIFISTPIQRTGNSYDPILIKNKILKDICRRLSIDVVDSMVCGIYDMTCPSGGKEGDFNDGLHLSPQGASKLGKYIANEVKNKYYQ